MTAVTRASIEASIIAAMVTQPIWVIRTRMFLNTQPKIGEFDHAVSKALEIYKQNGLRGFLKGFEMSLVLSFSGVLQMYLYEGSKILYEGLEIPESKFSEKSFICGSWSKFVAVVITYPLTTIRTRVQQDQYFNNRSEAKYHSVRDVMVHMMKDEGFRGFYKGILPNMMKGIPQRGIYFYFYELFKRDFIEAPDGGGKM
jgi:solute carrier family 25 folate transporter 32